MKVKRRILSINVDDIKSFYRNNNQLMRVLKMNEKSHYIGSQSDLRIDLSKKLHKINTEFNFQKGKELRKLHEDNEKFLTEYRTANKFVKKKTSKETFKGLIKMYAKKGYKIPDLAVKHNLFNLCPLIEENSEKIIQGFKKDKKLSTKTMNYLRKLNVIVKQHMHLDNDEDERYSKYNRNSQNDIKAATMQRIEIEEENEEKLKENISLLLNMINNKVIDKIDGLYTDKQCISRKSTNRQNSIQNNDHFDFLSLKSHSIINNKTPGRRISNFFLCASPNVLKSRNSNKNFFVKTPSSSRRESFRSPFGKFGSTVSTNFRSTKNSNFYSNFNNGLCLSLESKYSKIEDLVQYAYDKAINNDFFSLQNALKVILKKFKNCTDTEIEDILIDSKDNLDSDKVLKSIDKTKKIVNNDIDRKTKTIYLNSQMLNRIKPLLKEMEDADMKIKKMDKKLIQGLVTK